MSATILRTLFGCRHERLSASALTLALTIILASCGGTSGRGGNGEPMPTATLTISPSTIVAGQTFTLNWTSSNGESGTINNGVGQVGLGPGSTSFTQGTTGYPTGTTTYTYTVTGPGGTATASATVTLNLVTSYLGIINSNTDDPQEQDIDANGAIGTHQYMEYVNHVYQAYDKITGTPVWSVPAEEISTLWPEGSPCKIEEPSGTSAIQLDAVIIFDRLASRWVVGAKTSDASAGYYFCLAISSTDDLTSKSLTWSGYSSSKLDPVLGQNAEGHTYFPDWPKIATWSDASGQQSAYYATMDLEDIDNADAEVGAVICAFDRPDILNNPANIKPQVCVNLATLGFAPLSSGGVFLGHSLIPADIDSPTPLPPSGRDEFMVSIQNPPNTSCPNDQANTSCEINLWDLHVDWTASPPTLGVSQSFLPTMPYTPGCFLYDPENPAVTNCVPQQQIQGQQLIDSVGDRLMPRLAYRNFGNYESYLVSHTILTGPGPSGNTPSANQTGIRWYELRFSNGTLAVNQQGTISPDTTLFRFLPSIAQDQKGNVAVGYSTSDSLPGIFPSIAFSYWNLPNSTPATELTILDGGGDEITPGNGVGKWGSYSSMTVDPTDGCTFWYVNEYYTDANTWRTELANFAIPGCQ